jgi:hypothetical protein
MLPRALCASILSLSMLAVAGCATTQGAQSTVPEEVFTPPTSLWAHDIPPAPAPVIEAPPPAWTTLEGDASDAVLSLADLPADCTVTREGALRSIACPGWDVLVEVRDETPGALDVDGLTVDTLEWFKARGAKVVVLGSPDCKVGNLAAPCSFIEANSEVGHVGSGYVAVGDDGDRAFSLRCLYGSEARDTELTDPACNELLRLAYR